MFGIGAQELILLLIGALIIFGPQRLPEIAGQVGKAIRDFRRMSDELTGEFQRSLAIDEPPPAPADPALTGETIAASATPNGVSDTIAQSLRVESIPAEEPPAESAATTSEGNFKTEDLLISLAPVASKSDPLVGVSLLDEPIPFTGEKKVAAPEPATAQIESHPYQPVSVAEGGTVQNGIADAWDAVLTTEATAAVAVAEPEVAVAVAEAGADVAAPEAVLTVPEGYAYPPNTYAVAPLPYVPPVRERIDPEAEVTIREKIENQTAAEAFRERRRLANYQRGRKKE